MLTDNAHHASEHDSALLYQYKDIEVMDMVRFKDSVVGYAPLTNEVVEVREGTAGTVTKISSEGHFTVEVPSIDSVIPLCFVLVDYDLISLVHED